MHCSARALCMLSTLATFIAMHWVLGSVSRHFGSHMKAVQDVWLCCSMLEWHLQRVQIVAAEWLWRRVLPVSRVEQQPSEMLCKTSRVYESYLQLYNSLQWIRCVNVGSGANSWCQSALCQCSYQHMVVSIITSLAPTHVIIAHEQV